MAGKGVSKVQRGSGFIIQVNLAGLVVFSFALIAASTLVMYGLLASRSHAAGTGNAAAHSGSAQNNDTPLKETPAWGELKAVDVELEQPQEYYTFEMDLNRTPAWWFNGMTVDRVRGLMQSCGLDASQIEHATSAALMTATPSNVVIRPDDALILGLTPEVRARFYTELSHDDDNHYMQFPFCFTEDAFESRIGKGELNPALTERIRKLCYQRGDTKCFSDYEMVLRSEPSETERLRLVKTLSRQSAVLARLHIRPDTDIDKVLGYWGRGIQVKDVRPLLESLKRLDGGGDISLLYLLPKFARERLYTFPLPPKPGDPGLDCHWSTMNFFSETPDNRFANPAYTTPYLLEHYYQVAKPCLYGDLVLILNEHGNAIHSGVYLADDLIFTKNGNNYAQPWKLMRLKELVRMYSINSGSRMVTYRDKNW